MVRALIVSLVLGGLAIAWVVTRLGDPADLLALRRIDPWALAGALAALAVSFLLAGFRVQLLAMRLGRRLALHHAVRVHLLSMFSATVTPGGSGGLPATALTLQHHGLSTGGAWAAGVSILAADAVFSAWATPPALVLLYRAGVLPNASWVLPVGLLVSAVVLAYAFLVLFRLTWLDRIVAVVFRGPLLRFRRRAVRFVSSLLEANRALLGASPGWHVGLHGLTAASTMAFFVVLWALAQGFGLPLRFWEAEAMQLVVTTVAAIVPTPGASGFQELSIAYLVHSDRAGGGLAATVLSWRLLTYYLPFLIGPLLGGYLVVRRVRDHQSESEDVANDADRQRVDSHERP